MGYNGKKSRALLLPKKREAFAAIKRFMCDGDVTLRTEEEVMLSRWLYADALLKEKEDTEDQIIAKLMAEYGIARQTAVSDIANTQKLFAAARTINKKYLIHHHLQRIDQDIQKIRKSLYTYVDDEGKVMPTSPDAKKLAAYAKLLEVYTYTLNSVPDEAVRDKLPPPVFQFLLAPGQTIEKPMGVDEALSQAEEIIMKENADGVYRMEGDEDDE